RGTRWPLAVHRRNELLSHETRGMGSSPGGELAMSAFENHRFNWLTFDGDTPTIRHGGAWRPSKRFTVTVATAALDANPLRAAERARASVTVPASLDGVPVTSLTVDELTAHFRWQEESRLTLTVELAERLPPAFVSTAPEAFEKAALAAQNDRVHI